MRTLRLFAPLCLLAALSLGAPALADAAQRPSRSGHGYNRGSRHDGHTGYGHAYRRGYAPRYGHGHGYGYGYRYPYRYGYGYYPYGYYGYPYAYYGYPYPYGYAYDGGPYYGPGYAYGPPIVYPRGPRFGIYLGF